MLSRLQRDVVSTVVGNLSFGFYRTILCVFVERNRIACFIGNLYTNGLVLFVLRKITDPTRVSANLDRVGWLWLLQGALKKDSMTLPCDDRRLSAGVAGLTFKGKQRYFCIYPTDHRDPTQRLARTEHLPSNRRYLLSRSNNWCCTR